MDWYSAVSYVFASTLQILLLRFLPTFQEHRKLHHLSHGPLICSCSLWKKSLPKNSHYFRSLHTKLQLSGGKASTILKPFSACHPPAGTSSSSTESRASTSGGKVFLLYFVRRSSWTTKRPKESSEAPFLVLLQRILSYPNTRRQTAYSFLLELFLKTGVLLFQETQCILALSTLVSHIQTEPVQQLC